MQVSSTVYYRGQGSHTSLHAYTVTQPACDWPGSGLFTTAYHERVSDVLFYVECHDGYGVTR